MDKCSLGPSNICILLTYVHLNVFLSLMLFVFTLIFYEIIYLEINDNINISTASTITL